MPKIVKTESGLTVMMEGKPIFFKKGSDKYNIISRYLKNKDEDGLRRFLIKPLALRL